MKVILTESVLKSVMVLKVLTEWMMWNSGLIRTLSKLWLEMWCEVAWPYLMYNLKSVCYNNKKVVTMILLFFRTFHTTPDWRKKLASNINLSDFCTTGHRGFPAKLDPTTKHFSPPHPVLFLKPGAITQTQGTTRRILSLTCLPTCLPAYLPAFVPTYQPNLSRTFRRFCRFSCMLDLIGQYTLLANQ